MGTNRKLFCQLSPLAYKISIQKCIVLRKIKNVLSFKKLAIKKQFQTLPFLVYEHRSLIRRRLGDVDMQLQENKACNLAIAAPKISGIIIQPGQTFSFWHLVGKCTAKKGYKMGLTISNNKTAQDVGGGMCQFTNLIHWMVLHTPLQICEHHHHDRFDLFPDYGRQIPFGTGTSIYYNYLDYRFVNNTQNTYQLVLHTEEKYLVGRLYCSKVPTEKYHIKAIDERFVNSADGVYRINKIRQTCVNIRTGGIIEEKIIKENLAKVMYDTSKLDIVST